MFIRGHTVTRVGGFPEWGVQLRDTEEGWRYSLKNNRSSLCSLVEDRPVTINDYGWIDSSIGGFGAWSDPSEIVVTYTAVSWLILQMRIRKNLYAVSPRSLC